VSSQRPTCKLCRDAACTPKAHILPRWIYKSFLGEKQQIVLQDDPVSKPRITQSGLHAPDLVCSKCEKLFNDPDTYAAKFFRDSNWSVMTFSAVHGTPPGRSSSTLFIRTETDTEYGLLKRFLLNSIWRMHHSDDEFFAAVNLSDTEESQLSELVRYQKPGDYKELPSTVFRLLHESDRYKPTSQFLLHPHTATNDRGHKYCKINIPNFDISILITPDTNHALPDEFILKPGKFSVLGIPFSESELPKIAYETARKHLRGRTSHFLKPPKN